MSLLTWCEECGGDMEGHSYVCDDCGKELCYHCYLAHLSESFTYEEEE